jgi:hypothetical protein
MPVLCSAVSFAAVDGVVMNRTTGKPQPGATVTRYKLSQNGLESVESVKADAQGKFVINQDLQGPRLVQSAYDGVTYNHMLPPGRPSTGLSLDVYNATKQPGDAKLMQHMVLLEPSGSEMAVRETYFWMNTGKTTFYDPAGGALRVYAPVESKGIQVNVTAPQGQPIRRAAEATGVPDVYKIDFPIKPGESTVDLTYTMPFKSPGTFAGKVFFKGGPTSFIVPQGVTVKGEGLESKGQEPRFKASIFQTTASSYKLEIEGSGAMQREPAAGEQEQQGPQIQFVLPKLYDKMYWVLALSFSILILGFVLLYRAGQTVAVKKK